MKNHGLINIGNSCYINSSIQLLLNNPYFIQYSQSDEKNELIDAFIEIINSKENVMSPKNIKNIIAKKNEFFNNNSQLDSHEWLINVFDYFWENSENTAKVEYKNVSNKDKKIIDTYKQINKRIKQNVINKDEYYKVLIKLLKKYEVPIETYLNIKYISKLYKKKYNYFLYNIFIFTETKYECLKCGYILFKQDHTPILQLNIHPTLTDCLNKYNEKELLEDYKCDRCLQTQTQKQTQIYNPPKILYIQLCRFQNNLQKNNLFIEIPETLNLIKYCNESTKKQYKRLNYKLIGKINHYGSTYGGHYTADCYDFNKNKWYNFNDERVNIQKQDVGNEYIIMYFLEE